jgi:hypothetical protein
VEAPRAAAPHIQLDDMALDLSPVPSQQDYRPAPPVSSGCPSCRAPLSPGAVICVNCGFNLRSGQKLGTARVVETPVQETGRRSGGSGAAMFFLRWDFILGYVSLIGIGISLVGRGDDTVSLAGWGIAGLAAFALVIAGALMQLRAILEEGFVQLILCWLVPFYSLYFLLTHWETMRRGFCTNLVGTVLLVGGVLARGR